MRRPRRSICARLAILALAACKAADLGGGGSGGKVSRIVVTPSSASVLIGQTQQFTATAYDDNNNVVSGITFTWASGGPQWVSVTQTGLATGLAQTGEAQGISATAPNNVRGEATLAVSPATAIGSVTISPSSALLGVGQTVQLTAVVKDQNGVTMTGQTVTWSTGDASKASVTSAGLVTGVASGGPVAITAADGSVQGNAAITVQPNAVSTELFAVAICGGSGFAVGAGGRLLRLSGTTWQPGQSGTTLDLYSVVADCTQQTMTATAAGADGTILHFDGANWNPVSSGTTATLFGLDDNSPPGFAVGGGGTIDAYSGTAWGTVASGTANALYWIRGVTGVAAVSGIAVGAGGTILLRTGAGWGPVTSGTTEDLRAAGATSNGVAVFAVGSGGTIRRSSVSNLASWAATTSGTVNDLLSLYTPSGSAEAFAVGAGGAILHYNGTAWTAQSSPTAVRLNAVTGTSPTDVWAVGVGGAILHYDGTSWTSANGTPPMPVASVSVAPATASVGVGQTAQLVATTKDATGAVLFGRTVQWSSSNAAVASVDPVSGVVTGSATGGPVTITATSEGRSGSAQVTVTSPVATVTVTPSSVAVGVGLTSQLTATARDGNGTVLAGRTFTWSSANPSIATVSVSGLVTGVASGGPVAVTATCEGVNGSAQVTVYVPVATVTVSPATGVVATGQFIQLTATAKDAANNVLTGRAFTWATSNAAIAVVDATGIVTGVASGGPVTITAMAEGKSGTSSITIAPPVASVAVTPASVSIGVGGTIQLSATARDSAGHVLAGRTVAWTSSNASRATVSATGLVTGAAAGAPATITATVEGKKGVSSVTVSAAVATVAVTPPSSTIPPGGRVQLTATLSDVNGLLLPGHVVSWASSNSAIATVDSTGVVTGVANGGPVTITAASEGQIGTTSVTVATPAPVATVIVAPNAAMLGGGESIVLTAVTLDGTGTAVAGRAITWSTSNSAAATVVAIGPSTAIVTGVADGSATITAVSEGKSGTSAITTARVSFSAVSSGVGFTCALTTAGAAYCWGNNVAGGLGIGSADTLPHPSPAAVVGGLTFTTISAGGGGHACGLVAGGAMYCWGDNSFGELGIGTVDAAPHPAPVAVAGGHSFIALTTNGPYTCGVDASGAAWCWGDNTYGQLGTTPTSPGTPAPVDGGAIFSAIGGGTFHVCGATSTGAYCWGRNERGELGVGTVDASAHQLPAAVVGGTVFTSLTGGASYTCGVAAGGAGYCWGANPSGGLGNGLVTRDSVPSPVVGGLTWRSLSASRQTCGVTTSNVGFCWGSNVAGEMGIGAADVAAHPAPEAVAGGLVFTSISANRNLTTCGITTSGLIYCWGLNSVGELGNGTLVESDAPVRVLAQP